MNIIYKGDTLYVFLEENLNRRVVSTLENRVDNIMDAYNIENLVINTKNKLPRHSHRFEEKLNSRYDSKVVIK